jgi:hypothetical protein
MPVPSPVLSLSKGFVLSKVEGLCPEQGRRAQPKGRREPGVGARPAIICHMWDE